MMISLDCALDVERAHQMRTAQAKSLPKQQLASLELREQSDSLIPRKLVYPRRGLGAGLPCSSSQASIRSLW
jgi:hypothetical protein